MVPVKPSLNVINVVTECQDRVGVFQRKMFFMNCRNSSKPPLSLKNAPEAGEPMSEPDGLGVFRKSRHLGKVSHTCLMYIIDTSDCTAG